MQTNWNFKQLIAFHSCAIALLLSWIYPSTQAVWNQIDVKGFQLLNQMLSAGPGVQLFWAISSLRVTHLLHDAVMLALVCYYIFRTKTDRLFRTLLIFFGIIITVLTVSLFNRALCQDFLHIRRHSPTLTVENPIRLSKIITHLPIKDHSPRSFPSEHASTALFFSLVVFLLMGWRLWLISLPYVIYMCLPRLILGAHWITDMVMGSLVSGLFVMGLFYSSPFPYRLAKRISSLSTRSKAL